MKAIIRKGFTKKKNKANKNSLKRLLYMNKRLYHSLVHPEEEYINFE